MSDQKSAEFAGALRPGSYKIFQVARVHREKLSHLFFSFLRLGVTAFGGPAMVTYIRELAVEKKKWIDNPTFHDGMALCQAIPGATAMQLAAFVGLKVRGLPGAVFSFVGFGLPSFLVMSAFGAMYMTARGTGFFASVFGCLQVVTIAIATNAAITLIQNHVKGVKHVIVAVTAAFLFWFHTPPIVTLAACALAGVVLRLRKIEKTVSPPHDSARWSWNYVGLLALIISMGVASFFVNRTLFNLGILMAKIDLVAFGGGFSSLPLMYHEIVEVRGWLDGPTLLNGIALGQVTPGPIVITATFVGYLTHGPSGAIAATIGIFTPSFLMVVGIAPYFERLKNWRFFNCVITGILCSFVGLLMSVVVRFGFDVPWDVRRGLLAGAALMALFYKIDILWVISIGVLISVVLF